MTTNPQRRGQLSPLENLAVGCFSGALETSLQMPILTYKFCLQEGRSLPTTIGGLYRGVFLQVGTVAPITAIQFSINGLLKRLVLLRKTENEELTDGEVIVTAAAAGAISAFVYSPVDLVTIQQQKQAETMGNTIRNIVREYGMIGMLQGFSACAVRESVYTAGYLGLSPVIISYFSGLDTFRNLTPLAAKITGACTAGTIAAIITHPVDTTKTMIQADIGRTKYKSALDAMSHAIKEGGLPSLFRGAVPRTLRICGAFFVCTTINEYAVNIKSDIININKKG